MRTAVNALRRNKMRSALTTIGIIIGVAAVIAMVEISQGSKTALDADDVDDGREQLARFNRAPRPVAASAGASGSPKTLTPQDSEEIGKQCDDVAAVAPIVQVRGQVVRGQQELDADDDLRHDARLPRCA